MHPPSTHAQTDGQVGKHVPLTGAGGAAVARLEGGVTAVDGTAELGLTVDLAVLTATCHAGVEFPLGPSRL